MRPPTLVAMLIIAVSFLAFVSVNATASPGGGIATPYPRGVSSTHSPVPRTKGGPAWTSSASTSGTPSCSPYLACSSSGTPTTGALWTVVIVTPTSGTPSCSPYLACGTATSPGAPVTGVIVTPTTPGAPVTVVTPCSPSNPYCTTYPTASSQTGIGPCPVGMTCQTYASTLTTQTCPPAFLCTAPPGFSTPTLPPPIITSNMVSTTGGFVSFPTISQCSGSTCTASMSSASYSTGYGSTNCENNSTSTFGTATTVLCQVGSTVQSAMPITNSPAVVFVVVVVVAAAGGGAALSLRRRRPVV